MKKQELNWIRFAVLILFVAPMSYADNTSCTDLFPESSRFIQYCIGMRHAKLYKSCATLEEGAQKKSCEAVYAGRDPSVQCDDIIESEPEVKKICQTIKFAKLDKDNFQRVIEKFGANIPDALYLNSVFIENSNRLFGPHFRQPDSKFPVYIDRDSNQFLPLKEYSVSQLNQITAEIKKSMMDGHSKQDLDAEAFLDGIIESYRVNRIQNIRVTNEEKKPNHLLISPHPISTDRPDDTRSFYLLGLTYQATEVEENTYKNPTECLTNDTITHGKTQMLEVLRTVNQYLVSSPHPHPHPHPHQNISDLAKEAGLTSLTHATTYCKSLEGILKSGFLKPKSELDSQNYSKESQRHGTVYFTIEPRNSKRIQEQVSLDKIVLNFRLDLLDGLEQFHLNKGFVFGLCSDLSASASQCDSRRLKYHFDQIKTHPDYSHEVVVPSSVSLDYLGEILVNQECVDHLQRNLSSEEFEKYKNKIKIYPKTN